MILSSMLTGTSPGIQSLLNAVDPALPHLGVIRTKARAEPKWAPWIDDDGLFKILLSCKKKVKEEEARTAAKMSGVYGAMRFREIAQMA